MFTVTVDIVATVPYLRGTRDEPMTLTVGLSDRAAHTVYFKHYGPVINIIRRFTPCPFDIRVVQFSKEDKAKMENIGEDGDPDDYYVLRDED